MPSYYYPNNRTIHKLTVNADSTGFGQLGKSNHPGKPNYLGKMRMGHEMQEIDFV